MYNILFDVRIDVYPQLPVDLESICLLFTAIMLGVIVIAELNGLHWHATKCTHKLPGALYIIKLKIVIYYCQLCS